MLIAVRVRCVVGMALGAMGLGLVIAATVHAALFGRVGIIRRVVAEKEVVGIHTPAVIADVANQNARVGNWATMQEPRQAVSSDSTRASWPCTQHAIAVGPQCASPVPARVCFLDVAPKAHIDGLCLRRHSQNITPRGSAA